MIIGKIVGTVVSTRKNPDLTGSKLMIIEPMEGMAGSRIVAVDNVGAGIGEIVLVAVGSAARAGIRNANAPVDALIVGIVDSAEQIRLG